MKMNWNNAERFLDTLGLEIKRENSSTFLTTVGVFSAGVLTGAALGLLFAPKPGRQLRDEVSQKVGQKVESMRHAASRVQGEAAVPRY